MGGFREVWENHNEHIKLNKLDLQNVIIVRRRQHHYCISSDIGDIVGKELIIVNVTHNSFYMIGILIQSSAA